MSVRAHRLANVATKAGRGFSTVSSGDSRAILPAVAAGAVGGVAAAIATMYFLKADHRSEMLERMPKRVILVRHGESEGNCDHHLYRTKADNLIELTDKGSAQAVEVGNRIKKLIGSETVHLYVSPFIRTLQTARNLREPLGSQVVHTYITPQIREQEFGNLQGVDFKQFRQEQLKVGRLYYRFPTGESGCDVYDRVKVWWDSMIHVNDRPGQPIVDNIVVVTHGLTMRLILMQLYGWSPDTFHTVWNAGNCDMYVLQKDLSRAGFSPYVLDKSQGDHPKSAHQVVVSFKDGEKKTVAVEDYLSIPGPRTQQFELVAKMLADQHGIDPETIAGIDFFGGKFAKFK